jgi:hypothetical protein
VFDDPPEEPLLHPKLPPSTSDSTTSIRSRAYRRLHGTSANTSNPASAITRTLRIEGRSEALAAVVDTVSVLVPGKVVLVTRTCAGLNEHVGGLVDVPCPW